MNATRTVRVLYIDDDPGIARLVSRTLGEAGYEVAIANSGAAGLELLKQGGIDIVALDHFMPGETGLDILPRIRDLPEAPPVIYVTGSEDSRVAVAALKAGAVDYVWKDVQGHFRELLSESVAAAMQQERLRREKAKAELEVREARDRAEILLREVNHRVANSLQLVASLVAMQQRATETDPIAARDALLETGNRIAAVAQVHRRLYTSQDVRRVEMDAYLVGLVEQLEVSMRASGRTHSVRVTSEAISVPTDQAVSLGVIVTELVTNAFKYAYPNGEGGEIRVRFQSAGESLRLLVEDDGVGYSGEAKPQGSGLGAKIVKAMALTLQAEVAYQERPKGACVEVTFASH